MYKYKEYEIILAENTEGRKTVFKIGMSMLLKRDFW